MSYYKHNDEENFTSVQSIPVSDRVSSTPTQVKFHMGIWQRRSKLEKILLVLIGALCVLVLWLIILSFIGRNKDEVCLTSNCVRVVNRIMFSMNLTADPCDDFYQYSCGNWAAEKSISDEKSNLNTFSQLQKQNQLIIKRILDDPSTKFKSKYEEKVKIYYDSCLDTNNTIELLDKQPIEDLIQKLGGWSVSGAHNLSSWSFEKTISILHMEYNIPGLFTTFVAMYLIGGMWASSYYYHISEIDENNSSRSIIAIKQGGFTVSTREYYLNGTAHRKILNAYIKYMTTVGQILGGSAEPSEKRMTQIIDFETRLAKFIKSENERQTVSLAELQILSPFVPWRRYFENALKTENISSSYVIAVYDVEYFKQMSALLEEYNETESGNETVNNYLVWQMVGNLTSHLSKPFRDAYKVVEDVLPKNNKKELSRSAQCLHETINLKAFNLAIGAMFVNEALSENTKIEAEKMFNEIKLAFLDNFKNTDWMDSDSKAAAINKTRSVTGRIGYPEIIGNPKKLDEEFKDLDIEENAYLMNYVRINQYYLKKNFELLDNPEGENSLFFTPLLVDAKNVLNRNQIDVFPAILRSPIYDVKQSESLNFGALGTIMGHELTHTFDLIGIHYDQYGNLNTLWKNETLDKFKEKTNCFVNQYSNYEINGKHLNGEKTLNENIADNEGLKSAYRAYLNRANNELPLPSLNLSNNQLFFISFAQVWCSYSTPGATELQIESDSHSSQKFRVIGSLRNSKEFSREFNCPLGSKMNPKDKCEIW